MTILRLWVSTRSALKGCYRSALRSRYVKRGDRLRCDDGGAGCSLRRRAADNRLKVVGHLPTNKKVEPT